MLLAASPVSAAANQPAEAWNSTFSPEKNNKFEAVEQTADGGYIAAGSTLTAIVGGQEDLLLMKTDSHGQETWTRTIPGMVAASVAQTGDGGYIIGSFLVNSSDQSAGGTVQGDSFLIKTGPDGAEEWRQTLPGEKVSVVRPTDDGGYIAVGWLWDETGSTGETTAVITRTDGSGNRIWNRTFPGTAANTGMQTADSGYIIGGTRSPFNYDVGDAFLIRLDDGGNTLWNRTYEVPVILDLKETPDGGFVFTGNYWYGSADAEGEPVWLKLMEGMNGYAVVLRPDGGYVIAGQNIRNGEAFAFETDTDGNMQWSTTFPDTGAYAADLSDDGGLVLAGVSYLSPDESAAWMLKLAQGRETTPAAPGLGAVGAAGAILILLAARRRRG